jgi:hypothetical protein
MGCEAPEGSPGPRARFPNTYLRRPPRRLGREGTGALTSAQPTVSGVALRDFQAGSALRAGTWMMPGNLMATTWRSGMTDESVRNHLMAVS